MSPSYFDIQNLHFSFTKDQPIFRNVNLEVRPSDFIAIIGPNGAGKSTLLRLIAGLLTPQSGQIFLQGENLSSYNRRQLARLIGYVPQSVDMPFAFTTKEIVAMGRYAHLQGFFQEDAESAAVIETAISWLDLQELKHRLFSELSGGEKQRVIIASALAQQAPILLLDEPTSALDLKHQQEIYRVLQRLCAEEGKTIIVVTHEINLAAQFCNRIVLLDKGQIVADGKPEEVLKFPLIQQVYQVKVFIDINPFTKSLYILPYDTWSE